MCYNKKTFQELKSRYQSMIASGKFLFLAGAGISYPSGLPTWSNLSQEFGDALSKEHPSREEARRACMLLRPEVFLQAMYRVLGDKVYDVLRVIDPHKLEEKGVNCIPNPMHHFLAEMISRGHVVVTTNFDDLIEQAFSQRAESRSCSVACSNEEIVKVSKLRDYAGLVKVHGSFRKPNGDSAMLTIKALLRDVQKVVPKSTQWVLRHLLANRHVIVIGYSGLDDFDLYQIFMSIEAKPLSFLWVKHAEKGSWEILESAEIHKKLEELQTAPSIDFAWKNPLEIAQAMNGSLVKAKTSSFLKYLFENIVDWNTWPDATAVANGVKKLIQDWAGTLSLLEKREVLLEVLESAGKEFFDPALQEAMNLWHSEDPGQLAKRNLVVGRILYKKEEKYEEAFNLLSSALNSFSQLHQSDREAETHLQIALVANRMAAIEKMIEHAGKGVELYLKLCKSGQGNIFDLGIALRLHALAICRSLPDLAAVTDPSMRCKCEKLLLIAREQAEASLMAVQIAGNYLGERGQGQCFNVLGLIDLKLGDKQSLLSAEMEFKKVIDLSLRLGSKRERFQGYRNLGLVLYQLSKVVPERRLYYLREASEQFRKASEIAPGKDVPFGICFDQIRIEIEIAEEEKANSEVWENILTQLKQLTPRIPQRSRWHWSARVSSMIAKAALSAGRRNEAICQVKYVIDFYEKTEDQELVKEPYGVQNARENLAICNGILSVTGADKDLQQRLKKQVSRLESLDQWVPDLGHVSTFSEAIDYIRQLYIEILDRDS